MQAHCGLAKDTYVVKSYSIVEDEQHGLLHAIIAMLRLWYSTYRMGHATRARGSGIGSR